MITGRYELPKASLHYLIHNNLYDRNNLLNRLPIEIQSIQWTKNRSNLRRF